MQKREIEAEIEYCKRMDEYFKAKIDLLEEVTIVYKNKIRKITEKQKNDKTVLNLLEDEYGISPGQACVFYSRDNYGYKVLGGGWITK